MRMPRFLFFCFMPLIQPEFSMAVGTLPYVRQSYPMYAGVRTQYGEAMMTSP